MVAGAGLLGWDAGDGALAAGALVGGSAAGRVGAWIGSGFGWAPLTLLNTDTILK